MKKILIFSAFIVFGLFASVYAQTNNVNTDKSKIILVNPGVFYLKSLVYLTDHQIIDIKNLEYEAVFYTKNEISYDDAAIFLKVHDVDYIKLTKVDGNLSADDIYRTNSCTESFAELFENSDGIIFLGGSDIPTATFGQKTDLLTSMETPNRQYFEISFLYHLLGRKNDKHKPLLEKKPNYVVFGICLGMQSMNVATGGDMYQDIPSGIYGLKYVEDVLAMDINNMHRNYWRNLDTDNTLNKHSFHKIKLVNNQFFTKKFKLDKNDQPWVVSSHHQAVKEIGKGFKVVATSVDGKVVEALHHKKYNNVLGVQFHPEFYGLHNPVSKKVKMKPADKELSTEHELMKKTGSYEFQTAYWKYFSSLF